MLEAYGRGCKESTSGSSRRWLLQCKQAAQCEAAGMTPYVPVMGTVNNQGDGTLFGRGERGLSGAKIEIGLATMAYNLKRITNVLGATKLTEALHLA